MQGVRAREITPSRCPKMLTSGACPVISHDLPRSSGRGEDHSTVAKHMLPVPLSIIRREDLWFPGVSGERLLWSRALRDSGQTSWTAASSGSK